ncbi:MAG TPA: histidine kinase [Gemmatimonadaceae bacterium]|nr:histidine kinase [Gemmatimonadaceae bacterium]
MADTQHEVVDSGGSITRLTPGEIVAIVAFWAFLAVLTAAGLLVDPRVAAVAAMRAALRPEPGVATVALVEYGLWALMTVPIFWMTRRYGADRPTLDRILAFLLIGVVVAIGVDALLKVISRQVLPAPLAPGPPPFSTRLSPPASRLSQQPLRGVFSRFSFLYDFIVYVVVLGAGLARNYFVRYQARLEERRRLEAEAAQLRAQTAELHAQVTDARLNVLRAQLNPHFLFNTLNAVSTLVDEDPPGARRMIARLSDLLRHTLGDANEQEIPLARELEMLRRYLDIMEVRFQGKLEISIEAEPSLDDALVPNLVLQPLVENAFRHGLAQMQTVGHVAVRAVRDDGDLVLTVRDNGRGPANGMREGVGLTNTRARLTQLYGERQRLVLTADEGGGALVEVRFPYHTAPQRRASNA